jgi:hypothetical protein
MGTFNYNGRFGLWQAVIYVNSGLCDVSIGAVYLIPQECSFGLGLTTIGLDKDGRLNAIESVLNPAEKR